MFLLDCLLKWEPAAWQNTTVRYIFMRIVFPAPGVVGPENKKRPKRVCIQISF